MPSLNPPVGEACVKDRTADPGLTTFMQERERLIRQALRFVESQAVAEEIVQDSWLRWIEKSYPVEQAKPIFRRIVSNLAKDCYRRQRIENRVLLSQAHLQADAPDSERVVFARQDLRKVIKALHRLPKRTVRAFRMHRVDGKSYAAIAKDMQISPSTAFKLVEDAMVEVVIGLRR